MQKIKIFLGITLLFLGFLTVSSFSFNKSKIDYIVTISTDFGEMKLILFDDTPIHKNNFIKLAEGGKYNGTIFHRVINNFMIQGGGIDHSDDPTWDTASFINKTMPNEIRENHKHIFGALAAARTENPDKRSDISQFYIVQNHNGTPFLDGKYTVFGQLIIGYDVVDKIAQQQVMSSAPVKDCIMQVKVDKVKRTDIIKFYGDVYTMYNVKVE
jgi:peptidyl-prolyl cis-trans isomerase B (cyclophilin B)